VPTGAAALVPGGVGEVIVSGSLLVAIPLALLAGLISFASPCVLPLVPAYLSYATGVTAADLAGTGDGPEDSGQPVRPSAAGTGAAAGTAQLAQHGHAAGTRTRILLGTLGFIAGFSAVFVSYGALFGGLGATLLEHQATVARLLGAVVIVMGLGFLGWVPALQREARWHARPRRGVWGAPVLGVLFGLGWTPCIGPTLAAVQGLAFSEASAARGALLSLAYCVGLGLPFLAVGLAMQRGLGALAWARTHARGIQRAGGAALVLLGAAMVTGTWGRLMASLQGWISGWGAPL
jgi:cytochrome c-type biogenesis protein